MSTGRTVWPPRKRRAPRMDEPDAKPRPRHKVDWKYGIRVFDRFARQITSDHAICLNLYRWMHGNVALMVRDKTGRLLCPNEIDWLGYKSPRIFKGGPLDFSEGEVRNPACDPSCSSSKPKPARLRVDLHVTVKIDKSTTRRKP